MTQATLQVLQHAFRSMTKRSLKDFQLTEEEYQELCDPDSDYMPVPVEDRFTLKIVPCLSLIVMQPSFLAHRTSGLF